jgi:predicted ribosomally synthesized peptide with SipW-like signal peptide
MKRSLLLSLMFIGAIVGVLGFTAASFSDHESATATLTAGNLDLTINDTSTTYVCTIPSGLDYDEPVDCEFTLKNAGSVAAEIWMLATHTQTPCSGGGEFCADNGAGDLGPGNVFTDEHLTPADPNLSDFLAVPWTGFESAECTAYGGPDHGGSWHANDVANNPSPLVLQPGDTIHVKYVFTLGDSETSFQVPDGNGEYHATPLPQTAQGDSITLTLHFTMLQAGTGAASVTQTPCLTADPT